MRERAKPFRVGQVWRIRFLDHVEDSSQPEEFNIYGEVGTVDRKFVCIDCWAYADQSKPHDSNEKRFVILRSTILEKERLA